MKKRNKFHPAEICELSTHIAKFPSQSHDDLVMNEFLATSAFQALLQDDDVVELELGKIEGFQEDVLIIKRFDRVNGKRIHFEEFNQLLGNSSEEKYDGSYKNMADFLLKNSSKSECYRLYKRILAGILVGNTDMHLKNFAVFHDELGLGLTPTYDMVSSCFSTHKLLALSIAGAKNKDIQKLKSKHIIDLGAEFGLSLDAVALAVKQLRLSEAKNVVLNAKFGTAFLKNKIIEIMEKRWNVAFALIGKKSLKN